VASPIFLSDEDAHGQESGTDHGQESGTDDVEEPLPVIAAKRRGNLVKPTAKKRGNTKQITETFKYITSSC
jgi:hypothetical protein